MDWYIKGRLLVVGIILIILGLVGYFVRGTTTILALPIVGAVLLVAGIIYEPKKKEQTHVDSA